MEGDELKLVINSIKNGWPDKPREIPDKIEPYWTFIEELNVRFMNMMDSYSRTQGWQYHIN